MAIADYFLKLDGIEGEAQDSKHKNEIDLESWSWGETQTGTHVAGGGETTGRPTSRSSGSRGEGDRRDRRSPSRTLMPRPEREANLLPSVLDRLLDDRPGATSEPVVSRAQSLRALKRSVIRDLEAL